MLYVLMNTIRKKDKEYYALVKESGDDGRVREGNEHYCG
jgi:hypothetical protein